jgi:hypothetical protein
MAEKRDPHGVHQAMDLYSKIENLADFNTLSAIFSHPTPGSLEWRRIEALFVALNAKVIKGDGSRVSFIINDEKGDFHRPHPGKEAKRYQVRNAKDFLTRRRTGTQERFVPVLK